MEHSEVRIQDQLVVVGDYTVEPITSVKCLGFQFYKY